VICNGIWLPKKKKCWTLKSIVLLLILFVLHNANNSNLCILKIFYILLNIQFWVRLEHIGDKYFLCSIDNLIEINIATFNKVVRNDKHTSHIHLLHPSIQPSFKFIIKFVGLNVNLIYSIEDLKMRCVRRYI
jgi:hypothetical protein